MRVSRLPARCGALTCLLTVLALSAAAPASADVGETIILRCTHNESLSGFSQSAYRKALKEANADTEEYSECVPLIRQAQAAAAAKGNTGASAPAVVAGAAPLAATPAETKAIEHASRVSPGPVNLGSSTVRPGVIHADISSAFNTLPTPLLATLAFLLAGLLTFTARDLRKRVRDSRSD
jgi:hypothetical protein